MHFELTASPAQFQKLVNEALAKEANKHLRKLPKKLEPKFKRVVEKVFRATDTYDSLLHGTLRGRFGFPYGTETAFVGSVLYAIKEDLHIEFSEVWATGADLIDGITIYVMKKTLEDVLKLNDAVFTVDSPTLGTFTIPWLDWLLIQGDRVLVQEYAYVGSDGHGRSDKGIMRPTGNQGKWFRIPPKFSGTIDDNWITKTLDDNFKIFADEWGTILEQELTK